MFNQSSKSSQVEIIALEKICAGVALFESGFISGTIHTSESGQTAIILDGKYPLDVFKSFHDAVLELTDLNNKVRDAHGVAGMDYSQYKIDFAAHALLPLI